MSPGNISAKTYAIKTNIAITHLDILPVVAAGVGGLLGSMYLDAKLLLGKDLHQLRSGAAATIS